MDITEDTIAAVSTPPGEGGIGIVRISGDRSLNIAQEIFIRAKARHKNLRNHLEHESFAPEPRKMYYGFIIDEDDNYIDEVLLCYMPAPYTYTCEDIVEVNAHGGVVPLRNILELVLRKGARLAKPGEFTKRAFLNGRIDLLQAESVFSIIKAKTDKAMHAALNNLSGYFSKEIKSIRQDIVNILANVEAHVDFPLDDLEEEITQYEQIKEKVDAATEKIKYLRNRAKSGRILQEGLKTVIAGRPNVGKSSLYNYFLQEERAIVTKTPGTTRDLLIDYINLQGIPLKIMDTAGLRKEGGEVEQIGMEYSRKAIEEADLLLFMIDASDGITSEDMWIYENLPFDNVDNIFVLANKIDLGKKVSSEEANEIFKCDQVLEVSLTGRYGLKELEEAVVTAVFSGGVDMEESAVIAGAREKEAIENVYYHLQEAQKSLGENAPVDLIAIDLNKAGEKTAEILGETISGEVLDLVFSKFCIGK